MQRSRRLERQRLLQREYEKQSIKQGGFEGGHCGILVEQLQTAVTGCCLPMPSLVSVTVAVPSPAHSLVHCSRSPAAVLGVLFCPILNRTSAETVWSGPRARARALWVAQSSFYIERKWRVDVRLWIEFEFTAFPGTNPLRLPWVKTKACGSSKKKGSAI